MGDILIILSIMAVFFAGTLPTLKLLLFLQKKFKNKFLQQWVAPILAGGCVGIAIFLFLGLIWLLCGPFLSDIVTMLNNL